MKRNIKLKITDNQKLTESYHLIKLTSETETLPIMQAGQFVQIKVDDSQKTYLRRPISINLYDKEKNEIWLLIQTVGEGTKKLCQLSKDDFMDLLIPLGNAFSIPSESTKKVLLVGGGVGVAPMLFLGKTLSENKIDVSFVLGFRTSKDIIEKKDFEKYGKVYITTEDGSFGEKGYVTNHSILEKTKFDKVYTCGPSPMMQAVGKYCSDNKIDCEVSLENLMACGIGACLCCIEKTIAGNVCACTEGPVFNLNQLTWNLN